LEVVLANMSQMSHSSYCSNGKGVAVKITLDNLTNLDESKKQIIDMISKLFEQYGIPSEISEEHVSIVHASSDKVKITSDDFIQACISCLNDKRKAVATKDLCNKTFNKHLPKSYDIVRGEDNIIFKSAQKIDLLRTNSRVQYDESTNMFSLKEE
jgi:hypothetical protein